MHFKYIIGLTLILLVTKSHSRATEATIFYEDGDAPNSVEDDYYDDEEEIETSTVIDQNFTTIRSPKALNYNITTTTTVPTIISTISTSQISAITELPKSKPNCPELCDCKNDFHYINCSYKNLEKVPNDIPENVLILDLSNNLIDELNDNDFQNCANIQEIILTSNQIRTISKEVFSKLQNLSNLALDDNSLTEIHPDTFATTNKLKKLNLNNNSITTPENDVFLNQNNLKELYLSNNNLTKIYDETFNALTGLKILTLNLNDFHQKINTKAFEPLKELTQLKLPDLNESTIRELCEVLTSIDVINFEKYDISCFELSSGQTFGESIITGTPDTMNQTNITADGSQTKSSENEKDTLLVSKSRETKPLGASASSGITMQPTAGSSLTTTLVNNESLKFNESFSHIEESYVSDKIENDNGDDNGKTYQVAISSQAINHILLAIIIVAVVGLLIGVVCRKDFCGIKTKFCRTRRPAPTDQVRPAEEIPLNKV